jgi:1-acyl-sn-glycerol-3-phosphate acyltransferase
MIEARQNKLYLGFFSWYSRQLMKWHFKSVQMKGEFQDTGSSILAIANHFSWWDGFIVQYLNQQKFGRDFYFMMLEEQLKKRMFLNRCGGFSVSKHPRALLSSLNHAASLLGQANNLVLVFPQGRIETKYRYPFVFERGIEEIIKRASIPVQILFIANLVDYFSNASPSLFINFQQADLGTRLDRSRIEEAYNAFFADCIAKQEEP